jgi:hypothetical protein
MNQGTKSSQKKVPQTSSPVVQPSRAISRKTSLFLHVRAGGRCEFDNCNEYLLEHKPTGTPGYYAEQAHIWAFSEKGPRGRGRKRPKDIHHIDNLMLLCKPCHTKIDNEPTLYPVGVLRKFKQDHEQRVFDLTGISKDRDSIPLVLKGLIGGRPMDISDDEMQKAVAPNYLRFRDRIDINLTQLPDSTDSAYWKSARDVIDSKLDMLARIKPREGRAMHVSVFALAAIPLLAYLGSRLSDKVHTDLYQRHRNPESWEWHEGAGTTQFHHRKLRNGTAHVGLVVNVSGTIAADAIVTAAGDVSLYELGIAGAPPTPLVLNTRDDLNRFVIAYVEVLESIRAAHPGIQELHVFPAVPAPIAITLGRHILPKIGPKLVIYDHDKRLGAFSKAITVG